MGVCAWRARRSARSFLRTATPVLAVAGLVGSLVAIGSGPAGAAGAASSNQAAGTYRPVAGARILDTRVGTGTPRGAIRPGAQLAVQVTGRGGVPGSAAAAVLLTLTATGPTAGGHLTVYPSGTARPTASNLNFSAGQTIAGSALVRVGADGKVIVSNGSSGTTQVFADVQGYYLPGTPSVGGALGSLAPARLLDTRAPISHPVAAHTSLALRVAGRGGVPPSGASAVVVTVTVVSPATHGYVTAYPSHVTRPGTSNVNYAAHQTVAGLVTVRLGTDGAVDLYNGSAGSIHLLVDVSGYYRAGTAAAAGAFTPMTPRRLYDSRVGWVDYPAHASRSALINTPPGLDLTRLSGVVLTVTVTGGSASGYLGLRVEQNPGSPQTGPTATSILNWTKGQTIANQVVIPNGYWGAEFYNGSNGQVNLIVDMSGYFRDPQLTWTAPVSADPYHTGLARVSCASTTSCVGSDQAGNVSTYDGSGWSAPDPVDRVSSLAHAYRVLSLSCPTTSFCAGVDDHGSALTRSGGAWSAPSLVAGGYPLQAVSCAAPTFCAAVDQQGGVVRFNGATWSARTVVGGNLSSVSCPTATFCLAAGTGIPVQAFNGTTWAASAGAPTAQVVSCGSTTFCIAADSAGRVALYDGTTWSAPTTVDTTVGADLVSASCFGATACAVGDSVGYVFTYNGATWSAKTDVDPTVSSPGAFVSCGSTTSCVAVDYSATRSFDGSIWTGPSRPQAPNYVTGLSCTTTTFCAAVDAEGRALTFNGSSWSAPSVVSDSALAAVSCAAPTRCVAVGGSAAYTFDGSNWSAAVTVDVGHRLESVSCPSTTFCLAGDEFGQTLTLDGSIWEAGPAAGSGFSAPVEALSCPSESFCAASVGGGLETLRSGVWSPPVFGDADNNFWSVSCSSPSFCGAGTSVEHASVFDGSAWGAPDQILATSVISISCPTDSFCIAVNDYGAVSLYNGGTWTVDVDSPQFPFLQDRASVSCVSADFCVELGDIGGYSSSGTA